MSDGTGSNGFFLTLGAASKQTGLGKATLSRAIRDGLRRGFTLLGRRADLVAGLAPVVETFHDGTFIAPHEDRASRSIRRNWRVSRRW